MRSNAFPEKELLLLRICNIKKESLDIEIEGKWYQLTGQYQMDSMLPRQRFLLFVTRSIRCQWQNDEN